LDKADSVDIWVTCNASFRVGSNGKLVAVIDNGNGTKTHRWAERYPISTYLVSIALTNFAEFSNWFHYSPTDSMQVLNYVLPEHLTTALDSLPRTVEVLGIFSNLFGLYPFINEKYGHAEFGRGGAMEHQTMTSTVAFTEYLIVHELAHQWFGDLITCANWPNIWLNEGFAKYSEALYTEAKYGTAAYHRFMASQASDSKSALGSIYQRDTSVVRQLFDFRLVYQKGAVVLHMLRHVLGDSVFFRAMRSYVDDPRFRFNVATTEGFRNVCETVSGQQLGYFFNQWVYGEKYPRYTFSWSTRPSSGGHEVAIKIKQTTGTTNPSFFMMPIDFKLSTTDWDTTVVLFNVVNEQEFVLYVSHKPTTVALDPDGWILHDDESSISPLPTRYVLEQNYPNPCPFNSTTRIKFSIPPVGTRQAVSLRVYNILGQEVAALVNERLDPGIYETVFDVSGLPSGVYFYRLLAEGFLATRKFILLR
jgi:aminopeptidase N